MRLASRAWRRGWFLAGAAALVLAYLTATTLLWDARTWAGTGPLAYNPRTAAVQGPSSRVAEACRAQPTVGPPGDYRSLKVIPGTVRGREYYACYAVTADGDVWGAALLTGSSLAPVTDPDVLEAAGAWPWIGLVKPPSDIAAGGIGVGVLSALYYLYYRRDRPGPSARPWFATRWSDVVLGAAVGPGWVLLWLLPGRSAARRIRVTFEAVIAVGALLIGVLAANALLLPDALSLTVTGLLAAAMLWGWLAGRFLLRPADRTVDAPAPLAQGVQAAQSAQAVTGDEATQLHVQHPSVLPNFADVGAMDRLKAELRAMIGLPLAFGPEAERYGVRHNGVLLHGVPGTGKTLVARATAGEFGLNLLAVGAGDLVSKYAGDTARAIEHAFHTAAAHPPCLLFFDEFDSIAARRDGEPGLEDRRAANQLLTSLDRHRGNRGVLVMAATNALERLDPAVTREGRFDRSIRIDLPDQDAREAIMRAALAGRNAHPDIDVAEVAGRAAHLTPAALVALVEAAAAAAFQQYTVSGVDTPISTAHLVEALTAHGGQDRPTIAGHGWDALVLDDASERELRELAGIVEDEDRARRYGIEPPSGLLLAGPPGTGKTTIARTFAAQTRASFYPLTTADLTSVWVGEAEQRVSRLFERARRNAPSIVFLDEVEAVAGRRGLAGGSLGDRLLTQLLAEIDGVGGAGRRVFVLAATNRPELLDPAMVRGGRLSRTIHVPMPDRPARLRLLTLFSRSVPLAPDVRLPAIAALTEGFSGGDLKALVQQAALNAMSGAATGAEPLVRQADLLTAAGQAGGRGQRTGEPVPRTDTRTIPPRTDA